MCGNIQSTLMQLLFLFEQGIKIEKTLIGQLDKVHSILEKIIDKILALNNFMNLSRWTKIINIYNLL
jgi:hypothetical protein